jgi:hypothetical protein
VRGRRSTLRLAVTALLSVVSGAAVGADYEMAVSLDAERHLLQGRERVRWLNTTDTPTAELWWHLYLNAFANEDSSFMREIGPRRLRFGRRGDDMSWGWTRITRIALAGGDDLLPTLEFMRPDDDNVEDFTVARVRLPAEVPPGAAVEVELEFEAQLPSIIARTGFAGDFHLAGQWFPKLGVFEGADGWNCHQYHANSEFFADFGSYQVTLDLPAGWIVGATGVEISRVETRDGGSAPLRVSYAADRVHDFAWTAAPPALMEAIASDFEPGRDVPREWLERAATTLELSAAELELPPCRLRLLLPRSQLGLAERHLRAARFGLAWLGVWYGPYPYPELTIVVPPISADEAGGMEYPTFVTGYARSLTPMLVVHGRSLIETVVIHEIGHQYFYGLVASNEFEQAFRSDAAVDWGVLDVRHRPLGTAVGLAWDGRSWASATGVDGGEGAQGWAIDIDIGRQGEFVGPVDVELVYADGGRERRRWDGSARWVRWRVESEQRMSRVVVDPDGVWALEVRRRDNYWVGERSSRVACRFLWWMADGLYWLGLFNLPWS